MRLSFGEYAPDQPPFQTDAMQSASGVYALPRGYRPARQFAAESSALAAQCYGGGAFLSPQGVASIVAGTATTLYKRFAGGWSALSTGYSIQGEGRWSFAQFGGLVIATNGADAMVKIDLSSGNTGPLGGSPPKAKTLGVVRDFLVALQINGDIQTLAWSGINNAEQWTFGVNQSDYQTMPSGGAINGMLGGEFGLILQRSRVTRMSYVGGNTLFQFDEISSNIGCVTENSVVQSGQIGFFYSDQGFIMWDGAGLKNIGSEKVNRTFAALYNRISWKNMSVAIDPGNSLVVWSMGDQMFAYNWLLERWSILPVEAEIIFPGVTKDTSLDELDELYGDLESVPVPLDDDQFKGGDPRFYVISGDILGTLSGDTMEAILEMGDIEMAQSGRARWREIKPLTDATAGMTLNLASRERLGNSPSPSNYSGLTASGHIPVRESGMVTRPKLTIAAATVWTYVQGLDVLAAPGGHR